jgi:Arc/MetJ-type ribon-helix-helix transcriptional regulator
MEPVARKKLHVAPFRRQEQEIRKLIRGGRYRNVTEFVREAIDHHLERSGRPTLSEQVQQMAEDFRSQRIREPLTSAQDESRATDETW